jgi:hypothetical protein
MKQTELATIGQVKDVLLISAEKSDIVIGNAIKAQLQVISAIEHPELFESSFELMLEHLDISIDNSTSENMKRDFQRKGAAMLNSMLFFLQAKLLYEQDENKKEGDKLMLQACELLANTAIDLIKPDSLPSLLTDGVGVAVISGVKLFENLFKKDKNGKSLFEEFCNWWIEGDELEKKEENFYAMVDATICKLERNHDLFGKSRILSELILRFKDPLLNRIPYPDKKNGIFITCAIISGTAIIVMALVYLISLFFRLGDAGINAAGIEVGSDTSWYKATGIWLKYTSLSAIIATAIAWIVRQIRYLYEKSVYNKRISEYEKKYQSIASLFS